MTVLFAAAAAAAAALSAQTAGTGPPPGKLIDIGGRKLHVHCTGSGSPAVILEAGAGAFAIDWTLVQSEIASRTRVCSYDRAGSGWSDPAGGNDKPADVVADLHAMLQAAAVKPPYLMVGASMGGIYVRLYDIAYPGEVAGFVLVDPTLEDRLFTMLNGKGVAISSLTAEQLLSTMPSGPAPAPRRPPQTGTPFDKLPEPLYRTRVLLETRLIESVPASVPRDAVIASAEGQRAALARLHALSTTQEHPLGDRPLIVLTRGMDSSKDMQDAHDALSRQSTNSRHTVVADAGHEIHLFQPQAVVQAIRDVLASVSVGQALSPLNPH